MPSRALAITDARADALHGRLLAGEDPDTLADLAEQALALDRGLAAMTFVLAQARLVAADAAGSLSALAALDESLRGRSEVRLVEARALEAAGRSFEAYQLYRRVETKGSPAAARADAIEAGVVAGLRQAIDEALARGRLDLATVELGHLAAGWPHDPLTIDAARRVAAAVGDGAAERTALRALAAEGPLATELQLRLAALDLEAGETDAALKLLEALAVRDPRDPRVTEALDRARFRWRIGHAPETVQRAAGRGQLSRADFARLIYWLAPGIRSERGAAGRIASDVVGHPAQEEVIRVVNLGLMRVDETLHRFDPDRAVRRVEALEAILRAAAATAPRSACGALGADLEAREMVCAAASTCGLIADEIACLPGGPLSGAEALEWIRLAWRDSDGSR